MPVPKELTEGADGTNINCPFLTVIIAFVPFSDKRLLLSYTTRRALPSRWEMNGGAMSRFDSWEKFIIASDIEKKV